MMRLPSDPPRDGRTIAFLGPRNEILSGVVRHGSVVVAEGPNGETLSIPLSAINGWLPMSEAIALLTAKEKVCEWTERGDSSYSTSCGLGFRFHGSRTVDEYMAKFCQYCGGKIVKKEESNDNVSR